MTKLKKILIALMAMVSLSSVANAQDPNFHIYICFGQSNMEGMVLPLTAEDTDVNERLQLLQSSANGLSDPSVRGTWRVANSPLAHQFCGVSIADFFGRELVEKTADSIKIGVIVVAVGGCDIRLFDKDLYTEHLNTHPESWFTDKIGWYGGNPYQELMDLAKIAQKDGVIKGFVVHQGEQNVIWPESKQDEWCDYVNKIYTDMLTELELEAENTPILVGEVVRTDQNGICGIMNSTINKLPETIETGYAISSEGCTAQDDNIHYDRDGATLLGKRYAEKMFELQYGTSAVEEDFAVDGNEILVFPNPVKNNGKIKYTSTEDEVQIVIIGKDNDSYKKVSLNSNSEIISLEKLGITKAGVYAIELFSAHKKLARKSFYIMN